MGWGLGSSASGFGAAVKALANAAGRDPLDPLVFRVVVDNAPFSAPFSLLGGVAVYGDRDDSFTVMGHTILKDLSVFAVEISPLHPRGDLDASARQSMLSHVVAKDGRALGHRLIDCLVSGEFSDLAQLAETTMFLKMSSLLCSEKSVFLWEPKTIEVLHAMHDLRAGDYGRLFVSANSGPSLFVYSNGYDEEVAKALERLNVTYRRCKLRTTPLEGIRITLRRNERDFPAEDS
jgi:mevalonate pyrophosphate decarboxylase